MADIGREIETIEVEPLPAEVPEQAPVPVEPEKEPVPV